MLTPAIRSKVDALWDRFWSGGIANPLTAIEQISYLLFMRRLDALDRIDEEQDAIDHRHDPLNLAAEVRVSGCIDDVDVRVAVVDRGVLREDRDAALTLDIVGSHHALGDVLVRRKGAGLVQQLVDERGLAVIDVGDDGDVAQVGAHILGGG